MGELVLPGELRTLWLIARRAALESLRDSMTVGAGVVSSLAIPVAIVAFAIRPALSLANGGGRAFDGSIALFLLVVGLMPSSGSIGIASGLFAGEREHGNLLPLLATPATNRAIFGGKVLGAVLPALFYAAVAELSYLTAIVVLVGGRALGAVPLGLAGTMVTLVPAIAILGAAVASVISSRVRTYQSAQMLTSLTLFPIMAALFGLATQMPRWGPGALAAGVGVIVSLDVLLILLGAATWKREEVMARR
jgi:ABC-type transport system involved in multi-copper enzyme maturation permease subunit